MAIELDPSKTLKQIGVNRFTPIQFVTLKVSVQLMHNGNVTDYIDVAIPNMMIYLEEFLPLVKHQF